MAEINIHCKLCNGHHGNIPLSLVVHGVYHYMNVVQLPYTQLKTSVDRFHHCCGVDEVHTPPRVVTLVSIQT